MPTTPGPLPVWSHASGNGEPRASAALLAALGLGHSRAVDVFAAAPSKAAASRALAVLGLDIPAREIEPATGFAVHALRAAGLLDTPAAYAVPRHARHAAPVVTHDGTGPVVVAVMDEAPRQADGFHGGYTVTPARRPA